MIFFFCSKTFFAYGLGNALTFPLSIGGTSILTKERPTESLIIKMLQKHNVTLFLEYPHYTLQFLIQKLILKTSNHLGLLSQQEKHCLNIYVKSGKICLASKF